MTIMSIQHLMMSPSHFYCTYNSNRAIKMQDQKKENEVIGCTLIYQIVFFFVVVVCGFGGRLSDNSKLQET